MSEKAAKRKPTKKVAAKRKTTKKKSEPKPEAQATEAIAPAAKLESSPQALVLSRHDGEMHERQGKGFSFGELAAVGLDKVRALGLGAPVDIRRRSTLNENVSTLRGWYKPAKKAEEPKAEKAKPARPAKKPAKKTKKE
jgi:ribosomal protein L13E